MSRGSMPGLFACALLLALAPHPAHAQTPTSGSAVAPTTIVDVPPADKAASEVDDNEARDLFQIGKDAFDEGRFERALKYFQEAYELSHRAALLSNIGTALDRLRRDQEALDTYRKYLEQVPQAPNRRQIEERIRIIESALARSKPAPQPVSPAPAVAAQPAAATPLLAREPLAPTPEQTARASQSYAAGDARNPRDVGDSSAPVTSRWWFWTGIGAVVVAAVVVAVAVSAGGQSSQERQPTLLDPQTRVREL